MRLPYLLMILLFLSSCSNYFKIKRGNGEIDTNEYFFESFEKINIGGNYKVKLQHSENPKILIETDENLLEYLTVEVHDDELVINSYYNLKPTESVNIEIYYSDLNKITSTGASSIEHHTELKSDDLEISLSGAGAIEMMLDVDELELSLSGAGLIDLEGYAYSQIIHLSGAGALEAEKLESRYTEIHISGVGNAKVNARKELNATITGMGNVEYYGDPDEVIRNITGLGKVERAEGTFDWKEENI